MVVRLLVLLAFAAPLAAQELKQPWWIVLAKGKDAIAIRADGKATRPAGRFLQGTPSPDGKYLVWAVWNDRNRDLFIIDKDGKKARRLTKHAAMDAMPTWSPDGKRIAFASQRAGGKWQIWVMPVTGGLPKLVTAEPNGAWMPSFAPDGNRLVYIVRVPLARPGKGWRGDVVIHDLDANKRTVIAKNLFMPNVSWSPDGKRLAVGGIGSIRIYAGAKLETQVDLAKADKRLYAHDAGGLVWRPDGMEIACAIVFAGSRAEIPRDNAMGNEEVKFDRLFGDRELFFLTLDGKLRAIEVPKGVIVRPRRWVR